jgi:hypothetical protein
MSEYKLNLLMKSQEREEKNEKLAEERRAKKKKNIGYIKRSTRQKK